MSKKPSDFFSADFETVGRRSNPSPHTHRWGSLRRPLRLVSKETRQFSVVKNSIKPGTAIPHRHRRPRGRWIALKTAPPGILMRTSFLTLCVRFPSRSPILNSGKIHPRIMLMNHTPPRKNVSYGIGLGSNSVIDNMLKLLMTYNICLGSLFLVKPVRDLRVREAYSRKNQ